MTCKRRKQSEGQRERPRRYEFMISRRALFGRATKRKSQSVAQGMMPGRSEWDDADLTADTR